MVIQTTERRDFAAYDLQRVRELAASGRVRFAGRAALRDSENLGYAPDDVWQCLCALTPDLFKHSECYPPASKWHDVYGMRWRSPGGAVDDLYIKLRLGDGCLLVQLCSFHRDR